MIRHLIDPVSTGSPRDDESVTKILLVEDNPADVRLVEETLASQSIARFKVVHVDRLGAARERLSAERFDAVLLDMSLPDSRGMDTLSRMRRQTASVPIVVLSGLADETVAMKAVREGAQDYLVKGNTDGDALARCICFAIERHLGSSARSQEEQRPPCKMLGFLGSKGGVGATTVACSFAMALQSETKQTVLLADFDFESSVLGFLLGLQPQYSLMDALRNADRLDEDLWKSLVCSKSPGFEIITAPARVIQEEAEEEVGAEQFQQVLKFLRGNYQWLVADLGRGFNQHFKRVLGDLDQIYVVTTPEFAALRQARLMAQSLRQPERHEDTLRLILNDVPKRHPFSAHEFQEALGCPIWAQLPHIPELSENPGGKAPLPKIPALVEAVAKLAGNGAGAPEEKAKKRWALH